MPAHSGDTIQAPQGYSAPLWQIPEPARRITSLDETPGLSEEGFGCDTMLGCPQRVQTLEKKKIPFLSFAGIRQLMIAQQTAVVQDIPSLSQ